MQHEFGKRTVVQSMRQTLRQSSPTPVKQIATDPAHMRKAVLAITLTIVIVGGMFLLPKLGQCAGGRGLFGLDWCRLMKASVEGAVRGVAVGRGTAAAGGR